MTPQCLQSLDNGQQCTAPAISGSKFCRHHDPHRPQKEPKEKSSETEPLILPPLLDKPSILVALNEVMLALAEGRIKRSVADTLLSIIKLANRLLTEIADAGLEVYPTRQPADHNAYVPTLLDDNNGAVALAASGNRRKGADTPTPAHQPTDQYVEQLMAKSHELIAKSPKPDARFIRA